MTALRIVQLDSVAALRAAAASWDELWFASGAALPTVRAEMLAQWVEQFKSPAAFRAVVVADGPTFLAALPLVAGRVGWCLSAGELTSNSWAPCGDLLLDPNADADTVLAHLLVAVRALPWQLLWLNDAPPKAPAWQSLLRACQSAGVAATWHARFEVGRLGIDHDWPAYQKRLPKNHRQAMNRAVRRLNSEGRLAFDLKSEWSAEEIEPWLRAAFELEDRGWKGTEHSSILGTPGMFSFFVRQAQQLAAWGQLTAATLRWNDRLLAYVYGFRSRGVYFAHKISYDPDFSQYSPGQVLFYHLLESFFSDPSIQAVDFVGPMNQSLSRWRPQTYTVGRVTIAPRGLPGRAAMFAYTRWWRPYRQWREARLALRNGAGVSGGAGRHGASGECEAGESGAGGDDQPATQGPARTTVGVASTQLPLDRAAIAKAAVGVKETIPS